MIFIRVDLPAPFSPTRPWISPALSAKSTARRACTPPKDFEMPESSSSAGGIDQTFELQYLRLPLTPALSRKRERGRAAAFIGRRAVVAAVADRGYIPSPARGRRWPRSGRMRVSRHRTYAVAQIRN